MRLFEERENRVTVSTELKTIPEFKEVLKKEGDKAPLVFAYIYFMCDYQSPYGNIKKEERSSKLIQELNLGGGWKPAAHIQRACNKYMELRETPTIKTLKSIREGLVASGNAIDMLTARINTLVEEDEGTDDTVRMVTSLLSIADKLPKVVESISALEEKVKREQSNETKIRGGGGKGMFED